MLPRLALALSWHGRRRGYFREALSPVVIAGRPAGARLANPARPCRHYQLFITLLSLGMEAHDRSAQADFETIRETKAVHEIGSID